jgi:hypothetical protein
LTTAAAAVGLMLAAGDARGDATPAGPAVWVLPFFAAPLTIFVVLLRILERIDVFRALIGKAKNAKDGIEIARALYPRLLRGSGGKSDGVV